MDQTLYTVENEIGPDHDKIFEVAVSIDGSAAGKGKGRGASSGRGLSTLRNTHSPL